MNINDNNKPLPHAEKTVEHKCIISTENIRTIFSSCSDFEYRTVDIGLNGSCSVTVCWLDGVVSGGDISEDVIRPLTELARFYSDDSVNTLAERILSGAVYSYSAKKRELTDDVVSDLTHGHCALIFDQLCTAVCFEVRSDKARAVSEPTLEKSVKGAKDSFVEVLRVNTALVRRRICSPQLKVVESTVGRRSHTRVAMLFAEGIASPALVSEVARRLDCIDIDGLLSVGAIEEYITDRPRSPFPQVIHTERPDRFAMYLLDGRVGLLIDGLPVALVVPVTLAEFLKVTSDSNMHFTIATVLTLVRYLALLLSLLLPPFYVAVSMYHQEMIPSLLLLSIIESKQAVPFSTAFEITGMIIAFALLQESGLRLPNPVGDTASIIGALIVGQAAVDARLVSPIAIIVVAVSGIACYTLPSQDLASAVRLCRFVFLLGAIFGGLFGICIVTCLVLIHLASIDSFGTNYTSPLSDGRAGNVTRLLLRIPKPNDKFRDPELDTPDRRRQK